MLIVFGSAMAFGQTGAATTGQVLLAVEGEVTPLKLTGADLAKLARRSVAAKTLDGKQATGDVGYPALKGGAKLITTLRVGFRTGCDF